MFEQLSPQKKAILALIGLILIWGYNWVVMKVAIRYSSPIDYAALRVFLGGLVLFLVLIFLHKPLLPREILGTSVTGLLQTSVFYGFSSWALISGGAGKTAILNYAMPFWVLLLAWPLLGERLQKVQWMGIVAALAGMIFILMPFQFTETLFSEGLAILSSISWAVATTVVKKLQQKTSLDLLSFTTWQMLIGSIPLILGAFLIPSPPIIWSLPFIATLVYSVLLGNAAAWLLWFYVLAHLPAGTAGLGTLGIPVVAVLSAWAQLGEIPTHAEKIGMALIIGALILNSIQATKSKQQA